VWQKAHLKHLNFPKIIRYLLLELLMKGRIFDRVLDATRSNLRRPIFENPLWMGQTIAK
jgi:hypothetical protein